MKIIKTFAILLFSATIATALNAGNMSTFGCGITKNAYLKALNKAFSAKSGTSIKINAKGGAGRAIKEVGKGTAHIGSGCRPTLGLKGEEKTSNHHVGWGALVFIVHPDNPIDSITTEQAKKILQGSSTVWSDLGGSKEPIKLYLRKGKSSGVGYSARKIIFDDEKTTFSKSAKRLKSSGPIRIAVSRDKNAFAIDDISSSKKKKGIKILKLNGIEPTKENIASGKYPLYRPLYIYTKGTPTGISKEFFDFTFSKAGQDVISKAGTVNLEEGKNLKMSY